MTRTVPVGLGDRAYEVVIGPGLLDQAGHRILPFLKNRRAAIVSDEIVWGLHGPRLSAVLDRSGIDVSPVIVPPGEQTKSFGGLADITDRLLALELDRADLVVAFGGGVVGDLAGFAAAVYKRGIDFVQIPTTLLAQVDSSVGGKTAIDTPRGKNLVGAFHQPRLVLVDLDVLATLPDREMRAGYAEVIKYGILGDRAFFAWCEANGPAVLAGDRTAQEYAVTQSVAAKARIVAADERETTGARALLNLGHTFGHALEAQTGFSERLLHGEAVALGMVLAARYSARREYMSDDDAARITAAIDAAGLPSEVAALGLGCDGRTLAGHMLHDKKMDAGSLPFVLLRGIGEAFLDKTVSLDDVADFLDEELQAH